jgi:hypothetical protein
MFRAYGALRVMDTVQRGIADVEAALRAHDYEIAAFQARITVLACASIRSLAVEGEFEYEDDCVAFDYFAGLPSEDAAAAIELANGPVEMSEETAAPWLAGLRAYVADTERLLAFADPIPVLRSARGAFGLIGLSRRWTPILEELQVPTYLLSAYVDPSQD